MTDAKVVKKYERPGDVLRNAGHRDIRAIANMANIKIGRLLKFYNDEAVLTEVELSRLDKVLGFEDGRMYSLQKWYLLNEKDLSIVRHNLLTQKGYSGYCGARDCGYMMPRTTWNGSQFTCRCGWKSEYSEEFIEQYLANKAEMR